MQFKSQLSTYLLCIGLFLVALLTYFYPVLEGKTIQKEDHIVAKANSQEVFEHRERYGEEPLWTNSVFGGMPTFQMSIRHPSDLVGFVKTNLTKPYLPDKLGLFFTMFLGFFILLLTMKVDPWLATIGGIAFSFSTFFMCSYEAGHGAKLRVIGFIPFCIATIHLTMRGKWMLGGALTAFTVAAAVGSNHPQIVYYLGILIMVIMVTEGVSAYRQGKTRPYLFSAGILLIAAILAIGPNTSSLWSTYVYAQESVRGEGSPLEKEKEGGSGGGLDKDYAMNWSYGKTESFNLMIPGLMGGSTKSHPDKDSHVAEALKQRGLQGNDLERALRNFRLYWGPQPMTNGPNYIGAVICFLFVLGCFLVKRTVRWWIIAASALALMMAWGKHLSGFNEFLLEYLPFYNKFRAPSMILSLVNFTAPLMAMLAVQELIRKKGDEALKKAQWAFYITGGLCLFFALFGSSLFDFTSNPQYSQQLSQAKLLEPLKQDRESLLQQSSLRSLIFIGLAFLALWAYLKSHIRHRMLFLGLGALIVVDLWVEDKKYLNADDFSAASQTPREFVADCVDLKILLDDPSIDCRGVSPNSRQYDRMLRALDGKDQIYYMEDGKEDHYRVHNLALRGNPFSNAFTAYHHKTVGGFHAAKLARYQDLIKRHLKQRNRKVLNMLNTRWLIVPGEKGGKRAQRNPQALGNAWFVDRIRWVQSAEEEIAALNEFSPSEEAVVHQEFSEELKGNEIARHPGSTIELEHYRANRLQYKANVQGEKGHLAVFSEIYYEGEGKDWRVLIDGEEVGHQRANYVLRTLWVPPGEHEIVFEYHPPSYYTGEKISLASSILIFLAILAALYYEWKKSPAKRAKEDELAIEEDPAEGKQGTADDA